MKTFEARQYQSEAADWISRRRRCALIAAAGAGKTHMIGMALASVLERRNGNATVAVLCNTLEQKAQWFAAFEAFPVIAKKAAVTVTCDAVRADFSGFDLLIVDECHHGFAETWAAAIATCTGALWGCTATMWSDDEDRNQYLAATFQEFHEVSRSVIGDKLAPARVYVVDESDQNISDEIERNVNKTFSWRQRYWKGDAGELRGQIAFLECTRRGIVNNTARSAAAVALAKLHSHENVLVLVSQIEHGKELQKQIPFSEMAFSKMGKKQRAAKIEGFRNGDIPCLVASSILDEGFDAPIASVLILVSGGKAEGRTIQRVGRVCRKFPGKDYAKVFDFADSWHQLAARHAAKRQEIFRSLGYSVQPYCVRKNTFQDP